MICDRQHNKRMSDTGSAKRCVVRHIEVGEHDARNLGNPYAEKVVHHRTCHFT